MKNQKRLLKIFNTSNKDEVEYPISKVEIVIDMRKKNNQILMNNIKLKLKSMSMSFSAG